MHTTLLSLYPALGHVTPSLSELGNVADPIDVPVGTVLFDEAATCQGFPLVLSGEVKVSRHSSDGRSLELYRVVPGELCLASSACLFRGQPLSAHGVATKPTTLLLIGPAVFSRWLDHPVFRDMVLGLFAERMADLTGLIDAVAFHKLDQRLAAALLGRGNDLALTHQELADELGTVRAEELQPQIRQLQESIDTMAVGLTLPMAISGLTANRAATAIRARVPGHDSTSAGSEIDMDVLVAEIASLAVYLGSAESRGMTGQSIHLDGGMVLS